MGGAAGGSNFFAFYRRAITDGDGYGDVDGHTVYLSSGESAESDELGSPNGDPSASSEGSNSLDDSTIPDGVAASEGSVTPEGPITLEGSATPEGPVTPGEIVASDGRSTASEGSVFSRPSYSSEVVSLHSDEEGDFVEEASQSCWPRCFSALDSLYSQMTWQRALVWGVYGGIGVGVYYLQREYDIWGMFEDSVNSNVVPVAVAMSVYEPFMDLLGLISVKYPQGKPELPEESTRVDDGGSESKASTPNPIQISIREPQRAEHYTVQVEMPAAPSKSFLVPMNGVRHSAPRFPDLAILIPCHNSSEVIQRTLESCLKIVNPEQIFVVDNGKSATSPDNTEEVVKSVSGDINYCYLPGIANKSIAVFVASYWIRLHGYERTLMIDDDVLVPPSYEPSEDLFVDKRVKGIVYPILADTQVSQKNWLVKQQRLEYKCADLNIASLDETESVIRPHGACSLWRTDALIYVMKQHNTVFHGEDVMMGLIVQRWKDEHGQAILRMDMRHLFCTMVPETYFKLFQQRVFSWKQVQFTEFWELNLRPFLTIWDRSFWSLLNLKNAQFYNIYTQMIHVIRYPIFAAAYSNPNYWISMAVSLGTQEFTALLFNYCKLPEEQKEEFLTVLTHPFYKFIDSNFGSIGFLYALLVDIPGKQLNPPIELLVQDGSLPEPDVLIPSGSPKSEGSGEGGAAAGARAPKIDDARPSARVGIGFFDARRSEETPSQQRATDLVSVL